MTHTPTKTLLILAGTRPEAIKMAPLLLEARRRGTRAIFCATAQHRDLLDQVLQTFDLKPDYDLNLMRPSQTLSSLASGLFSALPAVLEEVRPHVVLVQGDTTTAFAGAVAAFYAGIPVGHVEAGLRTGNLEAPFPEEGNRKMISAITRWHFAPTQHAAENLRREGIDPGQVHITGNTVIDALHYTAARGGRVEGPDGPFILVTGHRRESFGAGMRSVCEALREIALLHPNVRIVYPVHPNPQVQAPVNEVLAGCPNVDLIAPLDYQRFVQTLEQCAFVLTDSGGVQEEAPAFGKPVLVTRTTTERPEAVEAGCALLVGVDKVRIVSAASELLTGGKLYQRMSQATSPFGDGNAAGRILDVVR